MGERQPVVRVRPRPGGHSPKGFDDILSVWLDGRRRDPEGQPSHDRNSTIATTSPIESLERDEHLGSTE